MSKNHKQTTVSIGLFFVFLFGSVFSYLHLAYSAELNYLSLRNESGYNYTLGQCSIRLKDPPNGSYILKKEGDEQDTILSCILSTPKTNMILLSSSFKPNEEKIYRIKETKQGDFNSIPISTSPGTLYHFVNYDKAHIISCEPNNKIDVLNNESKVLESFTLEKGKDNVFHSPTPTNIVIKSEKPIYVFESSLSSDPLSQKESGDSDTTTLYGTHLFFYNPGHIWVSAYYPNTKVKILDQNQIPVHNFTINPENGLFLNDLEIGSYSLVSSSPITLQTGFLDNENYSYIFGEINNVNGFSFGDLLFYSPYKDVKINLEYNDLKKTVSLSEPGSSSIVSTIDSFSPSKPEYVYFSASSDLPFYVLSFSSGNNFGGEFSPGSHGSFYDVDFTMISSRVAKEFSKDQKNLLEIYANEPFTSINLNTDSTENNQTISLSKFSFYDYLSAEPLSKISVSSDTLISCLQLHNYTSKGLFYYVPPISTTISYSFHETPSSNGGLFTNNDKTPNSLSLLMDHSRWITFFQQILNPSLLPFTVFFGGFLLLFLFLLLWISFKKITIEKNNPVEKEGQSANKNNSFVPDSSDSAVLSVKKTNSITTAPSVTQSQKTSQSTDSFKKQTNSLEDSATERKEHAEKKKIHIAPEHTPVWMKNSKETPVSEEDHDASESTSNEKKSTTIESSHQGNNIRKSLRIHTPSLDKSSDLTNLPTLNTDQDAIFSSIKNLKKKKKKDSIKPIKANEPHDVNVSKVAKGNDLSSSENSKQTEKTRIKDAYRDSYTFDEK